MTAFKYDQEGRGYMGNIDKTKAGVPCQNWTNPVYVHTYSLKKDEFPDGFVPGAVCRNPENPNLRNYRVVRQGPWCFTDYNTYDRGICDISKRSMLQKITQIKYLTL